MNKIYYGIIQMIKSAVMEKSIQLPDDFDWKCAVEIAKLHKIEALVYYGAYYSQNAIPDELESTLKKRVFAESMLDAQQTHEIFALCKELGDRKIAYLPLKGVILKKYYPNPEMRYMSDADILIKEEEYPQIEKIMTELGYTFKVESNHEYVWNKGNVSIELHKRLIPSYNEDYYKYYGEGWRLAKCVDGEYIMSDEDFYIYLFTHLAKHYRDSGIGVKQFVDLWVCKNQFPDLDYEYIAEELKKLQLFDFHINCIKMLDAWFENGEASDITEYMTTVVFSSGVYGLQEVGSVSSGLRQAAVMKNSKNLRLKLYLRKFFIPYADMKLRYPILKKLPVLLPILWLLRIVFLLFFDRKRIKKDIDSLKSITNENINTRKKLLNYVGLDFNFDKIEQ